MIEIELDGKKLEVSEGCTVMHAAEKAGTYIPHFCYHKKLSIAANCRMCLVDIEKMPKPMPACATPVSQGMIVRTKSDKAVKAQKSVMEFLLVNHPLDCPICDQGGECQLQDLAVGYGGTASRYDEEKRVVFHKNIGPLVSMEEMSRCIHCTRCVRFGQEVAGVMELGMSHRGEHSEIEAFVGATVDSELSGNMIDVCPVGALTSKPFRYSARTWELSRRKTISPHDSTGTNIVVQVKANRVMRVVPFENEDINECWIADRDRFSYEALNSPERLTSPMIKQDGVWRAVDWPSALEYVANGFKDITRGGAQQSVGALVSPHSTLEEMELTRRLLGGLGSTSIDYRLRHAVYTSSERARWLGMPIAALSQLDRVLVIGSNLRKDHPLFAQRIRQANRRGALVHALVSDRELSGSDGWAMKLASAQVVAPHQWVAELAQIAAAVALAKGVEAPMPATPDDAAHVVAKDLLSGARSAVLLGNAAVHSINAEALLHLAQWIAQHTGASHGVLTEAANTVGAQLVGVTPGQGGLNIEQMLSDTSSVQAMVLLHTEPEFDSRFGAQASARLSKMKMVVGLTSFKTNLDCCDVLLPVAPFTETSGTFVSAEGRIQSFSAVVAPQGETRPAWKVLRVLGTMLGLPDMAYESSKQVLEATLTGAIGSAWVEAGRLGNQATHAEVLPDTGEQLPCTASIYQLDGLVRRATSLQRTADARRSAQASQGVA